MEIRPVTGNVGAEITGIDLKDELDEETGQALRQALADRQVIFFRGQFLSHADQKRLTRIFGEPMRLPYVAPMDEEPEIIRVVKEADEGGGVFGGEWHQDFSFVEHPPAGSILSAKEVPPFGGDTLWVSQVMAWQTLPEPVKGLLRGRNAMHVGKPYGVIWAPPVEEQAQGAIRMNRGDPTADEERVHPAVIRNPLSGKEGIFLNPQYVVRLDGMNEADSRPLLDQIQRHATRPEFSCRWRWQAGDVAIWDNFFTQHFAVNDYFGHRREMFRTTFKGSRPAELAA